MRWFFALILCFGGVATAKEKQRVVIHIDKAYPPYSFFHRGEMHGSYVDQLYEIFDYLESFSVRLEPVPWQRGKKLMQDGEGLALTPVYFHGHDWPYLYPYSLAYGQEKIAVVCHSDNVPRTSRQWPEDYLEYSIASIVGYDGWGGLPFRKLVAKKELAYTEVGTTSLLTQMILRRRVDCVLMEKTALDIKLTEMPSELDSSKLYVSNYVGIDPIHIGFSAKAMSNGKFPYAGKFKKELDIAIYKWLKGGEKQLNMMH